MREDPEPPARSLPSISKISPQGLARDRPALSKRDDSKGVSVRDNYSFVRIHGMPCWGSLGKTESGYQLPTVQ